MNFTETLKQLPSTTHIAQIGLLDSQNQLVATIENKPGQAGSVAVYAALHQQFGSLNATAAMQGLTLYAEHTAQAREQPGQHPNIDRLIAVAAGTQGPYQLILHNAT
jgi:hypothetical protein